MVDEEINKKIIGIFNETIGTINGILRDLYNYEFLEGERIRDITTTVLKCIEIYSKVNPRYDFEIIIMGINNIKEFFVNKDFVFLIDTLEFEIKASLIDMKNSI